MMKSSIRTMLLGALSLGALSSSSREVGRFNILPVLEDKPVRRSSGITRAYRPGRHYPHVGARQIARNTRQLAAGQISFIKHGPKVVEMAAPVEPVAPIKKARKSRAKAATAA